LAVPFIETTPSIKSGCIAAKVNDDVPPIDPPLIIVLRIL
jgi:hypothetical protein